MEHVNLIIVSGVVERLTVRYREDGTAVCLGSLRVDEQGSTGTVFKTFVPFEGYGKLAEALSERQRGDVVLLQGKVFWRKYHTKAEEEKSGLALLVSKHTLLVAAPVAVSA